MNGIYYSQTIPINHFPPSRNPPKTLLPKNHKMSLQTTIQPLKVTSLRKPSKNQAGVEMKQSTSG